MYASLHTIENDSNDNLNVPCKLECKVENELHKSAVKTENGDESSEDCNNVRALRRCTVKAANGEEPRENYASACALDNM